MDKSLAELKKITEGLLNQKLTDKIKNSVISGVHSKSHLLTTGKLSQLVGKIYHYNEHELFLSYFAALFHDIIRSSSENNEFEENRLSAEIAVKILEQFQPTHEEKEAVFYAIENHGIKPKSISDLKTIKEKVRFALFVADKLEQNGVRIIARRSAFVAGERLSKTKGDLQAFGFKPDNLEDKLKVVAAESVIRLTIINPENIYPDKLIPLIHPLYETQRRFVYGVFRALGMTCQKLAKLLLETKRADGKNLLQARNLDQFSNTNELTQAIETVGRISDKEILSTSQDTMEASKEAVEYFSDHFEQDINKSMFNWKPTNDLAKKWYQKMIEYLNGTWFNLIQETI